MTARWRSPREWPISLILAPWLASALMQVGARTLRRLDVGREYPEACWARGERGIVTFWHGRLLMMPFVYPGQPGTRIAQRWGFVVERGSATRGGARAFRQLVHTLKAGRNAVITPDGPKGPARRVKSGVIELSRMSGMPILPVAFSAWPRIVLRSWDRFVIPYPFARGVYVWGPPLCVPPELSKTEAVKFQSRLAAQLDALTAEADRLATARPGREG